MPFLLALDEGTTSARAALYDEEGRRLAIRSRPLRAHYPQPGWVEQDPHAIWQAQLDAAQALLVERGITGADIAAIGITNQRETVVLWDRRTGEPVGPAISWQCRRTAPACTALASSPAASAITAKTGLVIDAYFSASKLQWLLENEPGARTRAERGDLLCGTIDTWLVWNLTGGDVHVTDVTNASRTMLMDLATGDWSGDLLQQFGVPRSLLPRIHPSSGIVGETRDDLFGRPIPIAGIAGDQQAALFGQACLRPGLVKNTYGTGCFALLHTGSQRSTSSHKLLTTRAASADVSAAYALEGSVFIAGAAVQWLRDEMGLIENAADTAEIAAKLPDNGGVYFVPAFVGLGAPHWDSAARGAITGLTRGSGRAHIVRAALESIAYQTYDLVTAMRADARTPISELRVDGGAANNDFLMQFQADLLGCPVVRPSDTETTALGAAYLAGLATGTFADASVLEHLWRAERTFTPAVSEDQRQSLLSGWQTAIASARSASS